MQRLAWLVMATVSGGWLLAGCAHRPGCDVCRPHVPPPELVEVPGQAVERGPIEADLSAAPTYEPEEARPQPAPDQAYRVLSEDEAQCLAVAREFGATLISIESEMIGYNATRCRKTEPRQVTISRDMLAYREVQSRNKAAAKALELYYLLAEAESKRAILAESHREAARAVGYVDALAKQGLPIPVDRRGLLRQLIALDHQREELLVTINQLNAQLRQLVKFDPSDPLQIWPQVDWTVAETAGLDDAISEGLAMNPELNSIREVLEQLDRQTLAVGRAVLQQAERAIGLRLRGAGLLCKVVGEPQWEIELETRQGQLELLYAERERQLVGEVRHAVAALDGRLRQTAQAQAQVENWRQRVADLERQRKVSKSNAFEISAARLELLQARSEYVHQLAAWKTAVVKLKEAQGILAYECGFEPDVCCAPSWDQWSSECECDQCAVGQCESGACESGAREGPNDEDAALEHLLRELEPAAQPLAPLPPQAFSGPI